MQLIIIGTSAIDVERQLAERELARIYNEIACRDRRHDLLVLLGNMDVVTVDKTPSEIVVTHPYFRILDFNIALSTIDCMLKWAVRFPSHVIGYAYEREDT